MPDITDAPIEQWMQRNLETIEEEAATMAAAVRMADRNIGCLVVMASEHKSPTREIRGLVSETDLVRKVMAQEKAPDRTSVGQIMTSPPLSIDARRSMLDASHLMERHGVRHLCVSENGRIVGLISVRDLVRFFLGVDSGPIRDLDDVYRPLTVLMRTQIETIAHDAAIVSAAQRMDVKRIGALVVTKDSEMVGIVTERDLIHRALAKGRDPQRTPVSEIMTQPLIHIDINRTVHDANDLMAEKGIRHVTVVDHHKVVGILSVRDLIRMVSVRDRPRFLRQTNS